jgi:arginase
MRITVALFSHGKQLNVVGMLNGHGGRHLGCEKAVEVLQRSDIFGQCHVPIKWCNVVNETVSGRQRKALEGVIANSRGLSEAVRKAITGKKNEHNPELLVLGGDHSCAIGTWSGVASTLRSRGDLGLIWVDAHMDAHTMESSATGNIHGMPIAHLLGLGDKQLRAVGDDLPKIKPENLVMVGIRSYEAPEQELLNRHGVKVFYDEDVAKMGLRNVMEQAVDIASRNTFGFGMSIDLDAFRVADAPAVGTPEDGGIFAGEFVAFLHQNPLHKLIATELVEFMPHKDDVTRCSERLMTTIVEGIYERRICEEVTDEEPPKRRAFA